MGNTLSTYPIGEVFGPPQPPRAAIESPQTEKQGSTLMSMIKRKADVYYRKVAEHLMVYSKEVVPRTFPIDLAIRQSHPWLQQPILIPVQFLHIQVDINITGPLVMPPGFSPPAATAAPIPPQFAEVTEPEVAPGFPASPVLPEDMSMAAVLRLLHESVIYNDLLYDTLTMILNPDKAAEYARAWIRSLPQKIHHDVQTKLRYLKNHVNKFNNMISKVLHYATMSTCASKERPTIEEIRGSGNKVIETIQEFKSNDLRRIMPRSRTETEENILGSMLGFQPAFGGWLGSMPDDIRHHQTDYYWAHRFLENSLDAIEGSLDMRAAKAFFQLGFTERRAQEVAEWYSRLTFRDHQSLLYWAKTYIDNIFENDIFFNNTARYPFDEDVGQWKHYTQSVDKQDDEVEQITNNRAVPYINLERNFQLSELKDPQGDEFPLTDDKDHLILFHGTQHTHAVDALENEVDSQKGNSRQDFSDCGGFYLIPYITKAIEWAKHKGDKGAVMVFKIPKTLIDDHKGLDLSEEQDLWKDCVRFYLSGKRHQTKNKKLFQKADYIKGPMCISKKTSNMGPHFKPVGWGTKEVPHQFCVKREGLAEAISTHIHSVLFF